MKNITYPVNPVIIHKHYQYKTLPLRYIHTLHSTWMSGSIPMTSVVKGTFLNPLISLARNRELNWNILHVRPIRNYETSWTFKSFLKIVSTIVKVRINTPEYLTKFYGPNLLFRNKVDIADPIIIETMYINPYIEEISL